MQAAPIEIIFEEFGEADIPAMTAVMTRAFDDDARKHLGKQRGGPEGYDNGDFFRKWLLPYKESVGYKIVAGDEIIGGIIVWILPEGHNILGTIFIDPPYQDRGVGARTWQFIENTYPDTKSWRLATPAWATKNFYFYEQKCGFHQVDSDPILGDSEEEVFCRKEMQPQGE